MKNIIKISALVIAAVLCAAVFAACGNDTKNDKPSATVALADETEEKASASPTGTPVAGTFSWVKFDVPAGYTADEADNKITAVNGNDKTVEFIVTREALETSKQSVDEIIEKQLAEDSAKYSNGGDAGFGDRVWKMVRYQNDSGKNSRIFYALAGDGKNYIKVDASGMTENDEDVKVVLASLTVL